MPSLIAPYTLPSENTTEAQMSQNFSQMYILIGKALYSRNECCNNQLKTFFFPDNSFFQVHSHFSRIFNKIIKFQYFSRTGKTVVIFPGFSGAVVTLSVNKIQFKGFDSYIYQILSHLFCQRITFCRLSVRLHPTNKQIVYST